MIPYLGGSCPACGTYNSAAETACVSCQRPLGAQTAPTPAPRRGSRAPRLIAVALVAALAIAGGAYAADTFIPGDPAAVAIVPDFVKLAPGAATTFHASVTDARDRDVTPALTWTSDGGTVAGGALTAPTTAGSYRVTVTTANGVTAFANVLVEPGPASRVDITTPGTIKPSELASLSATVKDSYGNTVLPPNVTWSVTPATATIDADGNFRTRTSGPYTVEARSGDAVATSNVIVLCPQTHTDSYRGVSFSVVCATTGDIWIAGTMNATDTKTILSTIDRDVVDLEKEFALQINGRFRMFAYASSRSFKDAVTAIFPGASGDLLGLYMPPDSIVVDWEGANSEVPQSTIRHELSHLFVERAGGRLGSREIPAWFDEGLATVEQYALSGSEWESTVDRYCAASAVTNGTAPSLSAMSANRDFQSLGSRIGYIVGAQAVQFMRDDIGMDAIRKILSSVAIGHHWDDAYREASGKSWDDFVAAFPDRMRTLAAKYPGVTFATDTPDGPGVSFILYGYPPESTVRVRIENSRFTGGGSHAMDENGCYLGWLGGNWPSGSYSFTATGPGGSLSATLRK